MRTPLPLVMFLFLALCAAGALDAQIGNPITSNPIPAPITKRGLTVEIRDVVRDRKSTRLNSSHIQKSRMPSSA